MNIIEPVIDVKDWYEECNRVKKQLERYNEIYIDIKEGSDVNYNDIFDQKNRLNILSSLSQYYGKINENKQYEDLKKLGFEVDRSLKNISLFEKRISQNAEQKVFKN